MLKYSSSCPAIHIPLSSPFRENCNPTTKSSNAFSEMRACIRCPVFTDHNRTYRSSPAGLSMTSKKLRGFTHCKNRSVRSNVKSEMERDCIYMSRVLDHRGCRCSKCLFLEIPEIIHCKLDISKANEKGKYRIL